MEVRLGRKEAGRVVVKYAEVEVMVVVMVVEEVGAVELERA